MKKAGFIEIFKIFTYIGIQLLGGGYVIVPLLKKYIVEERNWLTEEELTDYFAMSQCIPGIIAGNIAVLAGWRAGGIKGAFAAISGIIFPAFISILLLAHLIKEFIHIPLVQNAFWGIRISVTVLIIVTIKDLWKTSVNSVFTYILFFAVFISFLILPVSPTSIIIASALTAILYSKLKRGRNA